MITSTSTTTPDHAHFDAYKAPVGFLPGSAPVYNMEFFENGCTLSSENWNIYIGTCVSVLLPIHRVRL